MDQKPIPDIVVGRLPTYLRALQHMTEKGQSVTSSQELSENLGISAAQIRKDLSQFGEFGKQGKGYSIPFLVTKLRAILKVDRVWDTVIVGAGNLGRAIANYQGFINHGFRVKMIFDNDPNRIGTKIEGFTVQDVSQLVPLLQQHQVKIAILTVPAVSAQVVTNNLVRAGVRAILTYAPITLNVPPTVHVQYVDPVIYLQKMTYYVED